MWTNLPDEGRTRARSVDNIRGEIRSRERERNETEQKNVQTYRPAPTRSPESEEKAGAATRQDQNLTSLSIASCLVGDRHIINVFV